MATGGVVGTATGHLYLAPRYFMAGRGPARRPLEGEAHQQPVVGVGFQVGLGEGHGDLSTFARGDGQRRQRALLQDRAVHAQFPHDGQVLQRGKVIAIGDLERAGQRIDGRDQHRLLDLLELPQAGMRIPIGAD